MSEVDTSLLVDVLKRAGARGATAADGFLIEEQSFSASVRLGQVDTVTHSREQRLALRVFSGRASAAASTSDLSRDSLERVVDEATALARVTAEDPHAGLPDDSELIDHVPDLQLEDHEGPEPTPEQKIELARRAEAAALAADPRITNSEGAEYFDRRARYAYATSHGFARGYSTSSPSRRWRRRTARCSATPGIRTPGADGRSRIRSRSAAPPPRARCAGSVRAR